MVESGILVGIWVRIGIVVGVMVMKLNIPLMHNNITKEDRQCLIRFLKTDAKLTHGPQVEAFEEEWSKWLGVRYSVMVNSGASANLLTMQIVKELYGKEEEEVIVPPLTWVSDIASIIQNGMKPVFVDISNKNFALMPNQVFKAITDRTAAVFLTHVLGFNGLTNSLLKGLNQLHIPLIEDVCESHGATHEGRKCGTFGKISNFSFYYAHHMTTIEGGMICTNDHNIYNIARMLRSHGMVREFKNSKWREDVQKQYPDLNPDFIFLYPAYNLRPTELGAVLGRNQLKRLDENNEKRRRNFKIFLENLDSKKYRTDFKTEGSVNYAFTLVLQTAGTRLRDNVECLLRKANVEFRRGLSGGGNQMRQPYLSSKRYSRFFNVEHVHFYSWYIGNYPDLEQEKIKKLCAILNRA